MRTTYNNYIANVYASDPRYKTMYQSLDAFRDNYIKTIGFKDWLESLRNIETIPLSFAHNIGWTYFNYGQRTPQEIPTILVMLERQYGIEVPVKEGILTANYWITYATKHWSYHND